MNLVQLPGLRTRFAEAFVELAAPRLRERLVAHERGDRRSNATGRGG
jgi:hypothetical protein